MNLSNLFAIIKNDPNQASVLDNKYIKFHCLISFINNIPLIYDQICPLVNTNDCLLKLLNYIAICDNPVFQRLTNTINSNQLILNTYQFKMLLNWYIGSDKIPLEIKSIFEEITVQELYYIMLLTNYYNHRLSMHQSLIKDITQAMDNLNKPEYTKRTCNINLSFHGVNVIMQTNLSVYDLKILGFDVHVGRYGFNKEYDDRIVQNLEKILT